MKTPRKLEILRQLPNPIINIYRKPRNSKHCILMENIENSGKAAVFHKQIWNMRQSARKCWSPNGPCACAHTSLRAYIGLTNGVTFFFYPFQKRPWRLFVHFWVDGNTIWNVETQGNFGYTQKNKSKRSKKKSDLSSGLPAYRERCLWSHKQCAWRRSPLKSGLWNCSGPFCALPFLNMEEDWENVLCIQARGSQSAETSGQTSGKGKKNSHTIPQSLNNLCSNT